MRYCRDFILEGKETFPSNHVLASTAIYWNNESRCLEHRSSTQPCSTSIVLSASQDSMLIQISGIINLCTQMSSESRNTWCVSMSVSFSMHTRVLPNSCLEASSQAFLWRPLAVVKISKGKTGVSCLVKLLWNFNFQPCKLVWILNSIHKLSNCGLLDFSFH